MSSVIKFPDSKHPIYNEELWTCTKEQEDLQLWSYYDPETSELLVGSPEFYSKFLTKFEPKPRDVWIATYPKAGTHWMTEIVFNMMTELDAEKVKESRGQMLEHSGYRPEILHYKDEDGDEQIAKMNSWSKEPRVYSTHIALRHLPEYIIQRNKVIVVMRNPKDTLVSYYHFHRMCVSFGKTRATFAQFFKAFCEKELMFGDWFSYNKEFWKAHKNSSNFLFVHFEKLKKNPVAEVQRVAKFLGTELSQAEVQKIVMRTSFKSMDKELEGFMKTIEQFDESISKFMRKGEVGDWKNVFTVAQNEQFDEFYRQEMSDTPDLHFQFE